MIFQAHEMLPLNSRNFQKELATMTDTNTNKHKNTTTINNNDKNYNKKCNKC